jgi:hypothetical protein
MDFYVMFQRKNHFINKSVVRADNTIRCEMTTRGA